MSLPAWLDRSIKLFRREFSFFADISDFICFRCRILKLNLRLSSDVYIVMTSQNSPSSSPTRPTTPRPIALGEDLGLSIEDFLRYAPKLSTIVKQLVQQQTSDNSSSSGQNLPRSIPRNVLEKHDRVSLEASLLTHSVKALDMELYEVPYFIEFILPCVFNGMLRHSELLAKTRLNTNEIVEVLSYMILKDVDVPNNISLIDFTTSYADLCTSIVKKDNLKAKNRLDSYPVQTQIILEWFKVYVLLRSHVAFTHAIPSFMKGFKVTTPTVLNMYVLSRYTFQVPRPFPGGSEYSYLADVKQNFMIEVCCAFKFYTEKVKRTQYTLKTPDAFGMENIIKEMQTSLHEGIFPNNYATVQGGFTDWVPGISLINKAEKLIDSVNSRENVRSLARDISQEINVSGVVRETLQPGANVLMEVEDILKSLRNPDLVKNIARDVDDELKISDILKKIGSAADSSGKVGDEFASVIEVLRHSIPVFGLFFLMVIWYTFKGSNDIEKEKIKPKIVAACLFLGVSYVAVPGIWAFIQKIQSDVESTPISRPEEGIRDATTHGFELSEEAVATISTLFLMVGFSQPSKLTLVNVLQPLNSMGRGVKDIIRVAYELFCLGAANVSEFFGLDPKLWGTPSPKFNEWKSTVEQIQSDFILGKIEVSSASEDKLQLAIEIGENLMLDFQKSIHQPLTPLVRQSVQELMKVKLSINAMRLNYKPNKPSAVGLFLFGPTSQGKTELCKFIERAILQQYLSPSEFERYVKFPKNYVGMAPKDKFWDSIPASLVLLKVPEFGQFPQVRGTTEQGDASTIFMFCDPEPAIVRMADVANKGKVSIQPALLMVTSNQEVLKADEIESVDALQKRLDIPIRVTLREGADRNNIQPKNWILTLHRPLLNKTGAYEPIGEITVEQLIVLIMEKIRRAQNLNNTTAKSVEAFSEEISKAIESGDLKLLEELEQYVRPFIPDPDPQLSRPFVFNTIVHSGKAVKICQTTDDEESDTMDSDSESSDDGYLNAVTHGKAVKICQTTDDEESDTTDSDSESSNDGYLDAVTQFKKEVSFKMASHIAGKPIIPDMTGDFAVIDSGVVSGIGAANFVISGLEFDKNKKIAHNIAFQATGESTSSDSYSSTISLNGDGIATPTRIKAKMKYTATQIGYDTFHIPDHVPFFHGFALKYPHCKFMHLQFSEDENSNMVQDLEMSTDKIWESFAYSATGLHLRASDVINMMKNKFGDLNDWTTERLITLAEYAKINGAAKIGFVLKLSSITTAYAPIVLGELIKTMSEYANKFKNTLYSIVKKVYKWVRENETYVAIGMSLFGAYFAYNWWSGTGNELSFTDVNSGNGNVNAGRELKTANANKAAGHLKTLARNYRANVHSGTDNARSRQDVCIKNMVKVSSIRGGQDVVLGHALFLEERTFLIPAHFYIETIVLQSSDGIPEEEMSLTFWFDGKPVKVLLQWLDPLVEEFEGDPDHRGNPTKKDLAMFNLLNRSLCTNFRSIVKHIVKQREIDDFKGGKQYHEAAVVSPAREIINLKVWRANIRSNDPILNESTIRTFVAMYEGKAFRPGYCGDILMTSDGKILGFHTNGDGKYGYSTVFYQEMFENILKTLPKTIEKDEFQSVSDLEVDVEPPKVITHGYDTSVHTGTVITLESSLKSSTFVKNNIVAYIGMTEPYIERKTCVVNTSIKNYPQARAKYVPQETNASWENFQAALDQTFSDTIVVDPNWNHRMFSFKEAIEGIPNTAFKKLPVQTSAGFPLSAHGIRKSDYFHYEGERIVYTLKAYELLDEVNKYIHCALAGGVPIVEFQDTLKNERRPVAKVNSPRLVSVSPLVLSIVCRMFYGSFMEYCNTYAEKIGCVFMTNPMGLDWNRIAIKLRDKGGDTRFGAGDFSGFDAHHKPEYMFELFNKVRSVYPSDHLDQVRRAIAENICYSYHHFGPVMEMWNSGMPSGNPMTTIINCLLNRTYFMYWWLTIHNMNKTCLPHFKDHVCLFVNGDDNLYGVTEEYEDLASETQIGKVFLDLGQVYTNDKKLGTTESLRNFNDITLSKRSFRYDEELEIYVGPLELDVVLEIPLWTKRDRYLEIALDNANVALRELSLHGEDIYNEWAPKIFKYFGDKLEPVTTSWNIQYAIARNSEAQV